MKTLNIFSVILFCILAINTSFAQNATKNETIKVWGNCGMCKTTIEKAAKSAGAKTANWNDENKELKVSYALNKTTATKIQQAIANVGYDTQDFTANNAVYNKLHGCCKYDRKVTNSQTKYVCTMHKDVTGTEPGKCTKCGMELTKVTDESTKKFSCPMHSDVTSDNADKCNKCGMVLKEKH